MQEVLVVLGSPNSASGELGPIAISRLGRCLDLFQKKSWVLCTGGWSPHFNTAELPHAHYAKAYLVKKGVPEGAFLEFALSKNTVDDAVKAKTVLTELNTEVALTIITSDYHAERAKLIFEEVLNGYAMKFIGVESNLSEMEYEEVLSHEKRAIASIQQNGLYY
ncbi:YdcF family protein [Flagellimonas sp. 2504JD4-2]